MNVVESIHLYLTEGSSNKEYNIFLVSTDAGYLVNTTYGPRGNPRASGTKTDNPVDAAEASKIYSKLVATQRGKGYQSNSVDPVFTVNPDAGRVSGWRPALLSVAEEADLSGLLSNTFFAASEKIDGERRGVEVTDSAIMGMNRKGLYVPAPVHWGDTLSRLPVGTLVDGEHEHSNLFIFDCVRLGSEDLTSMKYADRVKIIRDAINKFKKPNCGVSVLETFTDAEQKLALLAKVRAANGEGLVFRNIGDSYQAGISNGSIKYILYETSTCVVTKINSGVHSVGLSMFDASGALEFVGNVTLPPSVSASLGDLVDVRYKHRFSGGSLYQPVFKRIRTDLDTSAATLTQIRRIKNKGLDYKESTDDSDEADSTVVLSTAQRAASSPRKMRA